MSVNIVITNAGRAALVNAQNTGTLPVVITQVGLSQSAVSPSPSSTNLPGEFKRISGVGGDTIAPDTIHINMTDTTSDAYSLRSFGLYLANGTLFGIYGQAAPILEKVAASDALLAIDVVFADISAASLTFGNTNFLNPPATTERQGVVELATVAEAQAGIDALRSLTPASARAAILGWLLAQDGSGSGIDADMLDGLHAAAFAQLSGANFIGNVNVVGTGGGSAGMNTTGDVTANRGNGTGVYYFTSTGTRYLLWNGSSFDLSGGQLNISGTVAWNAGNDGAGSGLDADLLDGQDSSFYTNIPARLGYTPINKAGDTITSPISFQNTDSSSIASRPNGETAVVARGNGAGPAIQTFHRPGSFAAFFGLDIDNRWKVGGWSMGAQAFELWHSGNDGAGSGLDADLLDGQDSSFYVNIPARLGFNPVQQGTGVGQLPNTVKMGWSPSGRVKVTVDFTDMGNLVFDQHIGDVWRANNDGSGSGLDADMLDGFHASEFTRVAGGSIVENGGFLRYADGLIETWGYVDIAPNSSADYTLPTQHMEWVIPTYARLQARFGDTLNTENIYFTSINPDGDGRPASVTIWNADNFFNRVFIQTKGK